MESSTQPGTIREGLANAGNATTEFFKPKDGVQGGEHPEGAITKQIESITSKIPSGTFLTFAFGAMGISALLHLSGRKEDATFVGHWAPAILILGLYNKLVKLEGSSGTDRQ